MLFLRVYDNLTLITELKIWNNKNDKLKKNSFSCGLVKPKIPVKPKVPALKPYSKKNLKKEKYPCTNDVTTKKTTTTQD